MFDSSCPAPSTFPSPQRTAAGVRNPIKMGCGSRPDSPSIGTVNWRSTSECRAFASKVSTPGLAVVEVSLAARRTALHRPCSCCGRSGIVVPCWTEGPVDHRCSAPSEDTVRRFGEPSLDNQLGDVSHRDPEGPRPAACASNFILRRVPSFAGLHSVRRAALRPWRRVHRRDLSGQPVPNSRCSGAPDKSRSTPISLFTRASVYGGRTRTRGVGQATSAACR